MRTAVEDIRPRIVLCEQLLLVVGDSNTVEQLHEVLGTLGEGGGHSDVVMAGEGPPHCTIEETRLSKVGVCAVREEDKVQRKRVVVPPYAV